MDLAEQLRAHVPEDDEEDLDLRTIRVFVAQHGSPFDRRIAQGHLTGSAVSQIADGLAAAHPKGIVHRDLKPENVMIARTAAARSSISAWPGRSTPWPIPRATRRARGRSWGRWGTCPPEQASGRAVHFRSDQFAHRFPGRATVREREQGPGGRA